MEGFILIFWNINKEEGSFIRRRSFGIVGGEAEMRKGTIEIIWDFGCVD